MIWTSWVLLVLFVKVETVDATADFTWISPADGSIYTINISDPNACSQIDVLNSSSTEDATLEYSVSSTSPRVEGAFSVGKNDAEEPILNCTTNLINETSYNITLRAAMKENASIYSEITVFVTILRLPSANRAPVFTNMPETVRILRNMFEIDGPFVLFNVSVSDPDSDDVSLVLFTSDNTTLFSLNETNIMVLASLENLTSPYRLTVTASDDGTPVQSSTADLTLIIGYAPMFVNLATPNSTFVDENVAPGTEVFKLTVSDLDTDEPILTIVNQSIPWAFKLDNKTVRTNISLDKETLSNYTITFRANDGNFSTDSALLTIFVNDLNEKPFITSVLPNSTITINELTAAGTNVLNVTASDPDSEAPNNNITFSLSDSQDFSIDPITGIINVANGIHLNYTVKSTYVLVVTATDGGTHPLSATTSVTINIIPGHTETVYCTTNPCQNDGTCIDGKNSFTCICSEGWAGSTCTEETVYCTTNPCQNDGTCIDGKNNFTCNCSEGWTGSNCTEACTNDKWGRNCKEQCYCPNISRLAIDVGNQKCDVKSGACKCNDKWMGQDCNTDYDECQNATICSAFEKTVCRNTEGSYLCLSGESGPGETGTKENLALILGLTLGISLLLLIIVIVCCFKRKTRKSGGNYYINSWYTVEFSDYD